MVRTRERAGTLVAPQASAAALTVMVPLDGGSRCRSDVEGIVVRTIGAEVLLFTMARGRMTRETRSAETRAIGDPNGARASVSSATSA